MAKWQSRRAEALGWAGRGGCRRLPPGTMSVWTRVCGLIRLTAVTALTIYTDHGCWLRLPRQREYVLMHV